MKAVDRVTLVLPVELDNGNSGRSKHWAAAHRSRRAIGATVSLFSPRNTLVRTPVRIHVTRVLGKGQRLMDADSLLRGNFKEILDSIVATGLIPDDGPKFVQEVTASQDATRRAEGPMTVVVIESVRQEVS